MKTITSTLRGLGSSLLLNVGFSRIAQKLDPISDARQEICASAHGASFTTVCGFPAKRGA